jgi:ketosteroid isomerase-like protein
MHTDATVTEAVVRHHLTAFLDQKPVEDIVSDYADDAHFISETKLYRGRNEIHGFFTDFIAALPDRAMERFTLSSLHVHRDIAYITWSVGGDIPLGTDTFIVADGKIVSQTFAMYVTSAA